VVELGFNRTVCKSHDHPEKTQQNHDNTSKLGAVDRIYTGVKRSFFIYCYVTFFFFFMGVPPKPRSPPAGGKLNGIGHVVITSQLATGYFY
jgi:hypothetical protein